MFQEQQKNKEEQKNLDAAMVEKDLHCSMTATNWGSHVRRGKDRGGWEYDLWHITLRNTVTEAEMYLDFERGVGHRAFVKPKNWVGKLVKAYNGKTYCMDDLDVKSYNAYGKITIHMAEHEVKGKAVPPNVLDVLYVIYMDDVQGLSFSQWCNEFGYDEDSRKAMTIYLACQKQTDDFYRVFPDVKLYDYDPVMER